MGHDRAVAGNRLRNFIGSGDTRLSGNSPHHCRLGALVPTLIIIGIGITVHVLFEFFRFMRAGYDGAEAARSTIINIWRPAFFTAITTAAGFLLSLSRRFYLFESSLC